jgi:hypothetical protein
VAFHPTVLRFSKRNGSWIFYFCVSGVKVGKHFVVSLLVAEAESTVAMVRAGR